METHSPSENSKKTSLENLSKEELIRKCDRLFALAQKAKQAKDALQEENNELKIKLKANLSNNGNVANEMIETLTSQKLQYVTTIEQLKYQNSTLTSQLEKCYQDLSACEEKNNSLDSENVAFQRQTKRLTEENEQLLGELESLERQMDECKKLGLEQQNQLLDLEKSNKLLEDANQKLKHENVNITEATELQKMLTISLEEVKKLQNENSLLKNDVDTVNKKLHECDIQKSTDDLELSETNKAIAALKNQLSENLKSGQLLETENSDLKEEIKKLTEKNNLLEIEFNELKVCEDNSQVIKELQSTIDQLKCTLQETYLKVLGFESVVEEKDKLILELKDSIKHQESTIKENIEFKEKINDLHVKNKILEEELKDIRALQENLQVEELQGTIERLKEKLKSYHGKIVKFAGNVRDLKENKNNILSLFKIYTNQVEEWREELNAASMKLCELIETISSENKQYVEEIEILRANNAKFIQQLEAHKTDDEKSKELEKIEHIINENKTLNDEVMRLLELSDNNTKVIDDLLLERDQVKLEYNGLVEKRENELKSFDDQSKKDTEEIQHRIQENEKICIEYRKIISKFEEDININTRELDELRLKYSTLQEALENAKQAEQQIAEKTAKEILKLVQENTELIEANKKLQESHKDSQEVECQVDDDTLTESVNSLQRRNSELLTEMNEMNQALKERGETISKLQSHCEEIMKKIQQYENQSSKNSDTSVMQDKIEKLEEEIVILKSQDRTENLDELQDAILKKDLEISKMRDELNYLKEKLNTNLDSSYAESEVMSTSTISRSEEVNRLKDLEGSWEERYGKLRALAVKLKGKVRDLSNELIKEQQEKNDIQEKYTSNIKLIPTLQAQNDHLQDELEQKKGELKEYQAKFESLNKDYSSDKDKLSENEAEISKLKEELDKLNKEKENTEKWKKQISVKIQTFRKELDANKVVKKELEAKIATLTSELEAKNQALKAESDGHKQTRNSLEHSNNERKKHSVLSLEMQDYERSVKELSSKLEKKQDEISQLQNQLESQKTTTNAIREQNKLLEGQVDDVKKDMDAATSELAINKKQISELEAITHQKDSQLHNVTQLLETVRLENEELSTELSKVIAEHQKISSSLKSEKEQLRSQVFTLQQSLREVQDALTLKNDELGRLENDYEIYKVRAQSVLRQNQNRDVGLEEKLSEDLSALQIKCNTLNNEVEEYKSTLETLNKENEALVQERNEMRNRCEELVSELENVKLMHKQLSIKHEQAIVEHNETVRSLKIHAETLSQCYRQQLSEQEVRHNREIVELQDRIEKVPSPIEASFHPIVSMPREEGEGSESTENTSKNNVTPIPLERLLGGDLDPDVAYLKKHLNDEESKVTHLTALLADTEQDLAKHVQMNKLLKEEIRRQQRSVEREEHAKNLEYLKNVVFKFLTLHQGDERSRLVPVLNTILKFSPEETQKLILVAKGDPGMRGWTNYLPLWPSPSKP